MPALKKKNTGKIVKIVPKGNQTKKVINKRARKNIGKRMV